MLGRGGSGRWAIDDFNAAFPSFLDVFWHGWVDILMLVLEIGSAISEVECGKIVVALMAFGLVDGGNFSSDISKLFLLFNLVILCLCFFLLIFCLELFHKLWMIQI